MTKHKERWIAHNQDGMPKRLKPNTLVKFKMRRYEPMTSYAGDIGWSVIIAYQIVGE